MIDMTDMDFGMVETMQSLHDTLVYAKLPPKVHAAILLPIVAAWLDNNQAKAMPRWAGDWPHYLDHGCEFWVRHPDRETMVWQVQALRRALDDVALKVHKHRMAQVTFGKHHKQFGLVPINGGVGGDPWQTPRISGIQTPNPGSGSEPPIMNAMVLRILVHPVLIDAMLEGGKCCGSLS